MFTKQDKKKIAKQVSDLLRETKNPELPMGPIQFTLLVMGRHHTTSSLITDNDCKETPFSPAIPPAL